MGVEPPHCQLSHIQIHIIEGKSIQVSPLYSKELASSKRLPLCRISAFANVSLIRQAISKRSTSTAHDDKTFSIAHAPKVICIDMLYTQISLILFALIYVFVLAGVLFKTFALSCSLTRVYCSGSGTLFRINKSCSSVCRKPARPFPPSLPFLEHFKCVKGLVKQGDIPLVHIGREMDHTLGILLAGTDPSLDIIVVACCDTGLCKILGMASGSPLTFQYCSPKINTPVFGSYMKRRLSISCMSNAFVAVSISIRLSLISSNAFFPGGYGS